MQKIFLTFAILAILSSAACDSGFKNKLNEPILNCGYDVAENKNYIRLEGIGDTSELIVLGPNEEALHVSQKGCVERPKDGEIFVVNKTRTQGAWLSPNTPDSVTLKPIPPKSLPSACNTVIHGDGKSFNLNIATETVEPKKNLRRIKLALFDALRKKTFEWDERVLDPIMVYSFPEGKRMAGGEYGLEVTIRDELSGSSSSSECVLRINESNLVVLPADKIKTRRKYKGREVLIVERGYEVNFYIEGGAKDVSVDYCMKQITGAEVPSAGKSTCEAPIKFSDSVPSPIKDGIWELNYRGKRGNETTAWQTSILLVEKVCNGSFTKPEELAREGCTVIKGSLTLDGDFSEESLVPLELIGQIFGLLEIKKVSAKNISMLPNLVDIVGNLHIFDTTIEDLSGFPSLHHVFGSVHLSKNPNLVAISGLSNLSYVGELLMVRNSPRLSKMSGFKNLKEVGGLSLEEVAISSLDSFQNIDSLAVLTLRNLPELFTLKGLNKVQAIQELNVFDLNIINFEGLNDNISIDKMHILNLRLLESFRYQKIRGLTELTITDAPELRTLFHPESRMELSYLRINKQTSLKDLTAFNFADNVDVIYLDESNIKSLDGVQGIKHLKTFTAVYCQELTDASYFHNLETADSFFFADTALENVSGFDKLSALRSFALVAPTNSSMINIGAFPGLKEIDSFKITSQGEVSFDPALRLKVRMLELESSASDLTYVGKVFTATDLFIFSSNIKTLKGIENFSPLKGNLSLITNIDSFAFLEKLTVEGSLLLGTVSRERDLTMVDYSSLLKLMNLGGPLQLDQGFCPPEEFLQEFSKIRPKVEIDPSILKSFVSTKYPGVFIHRESECRFY